MAQVNDTGMKYDGIRSLHEKERHLGTDQTLKRLNFFKPTISKEPSISIVYTIYEYSHIIVFFKQVL